MKRLFKGDDDMLPSSTYFHPVGAAEFNRALDRLRTGGEKKHLFQRLRHQLSQTLDQSGTNLTWETVVRQ